MAWAGMGPVKAQARIFHRRRHHWRPSEVETLLSRTKLPRARMRLLRWLVHHYRHRWPDPDRAARYELELAAYGASLPELLAVERAERREQMKARTQALLANWQRKMKLAHTKIRKLRARLRRMEVIR